MGMYFSVVDNDVPKKSKKGVAFFFQKKYKFDTTSDHKTVSFSETILSETCS